MQRRIFPQGYLRETTPHSARRLYPKTDFRPVAACGAQVGSRRKPERNHNPIGQFGVEAPSEAEARRFARRTRRATRRIEIA